ncbi:MAG: aminotransferase class I/II-fold pyridoxal phosphate-dependent enzyme, partial [Clostridia bacterium]|nr:aminotransferase class I/II-fold pyridoxal phosphate-dependent enzyme [Deltaproteobacteria bacterium]
MSDAIPFIDLSKQHQALAPLLNEGFAQALSANAFIGGKTVETFENEFAEMCGAGAALCVANGTDALYIALKALGVKPGDVVLVPSFTFVATAEAVSV